MERYKEIRIGIVVILGLFVIILGLYLAGSLPFFERGYRIYVKFSYLGNLPIGGSVKLAGGIKVGTIESVKENPKEGGVIVVLKIDKKYKINRDAIFIIQSTSLVGEKYIDVINYTGNPPYLRDGDVVEGQSAGSLTEAISDIYAFFKKIISKIESTPNIGSSLDRLVLSIYYLEKILEEINKNKEHISSSIKEVSEITSTLKVALEDAKRAIKDISTAANSLGSLEIRKLNNVIDSLEFTVNQINKSLTNTNSTISVLFDEETGKSLRRTIRNLEIFSKKISDDPSSLIKFFK
jgi:phospholipid/cholesterol/gamma-HCH transport system substrate-binding protein